MTRRKDNTMGFSTKTQELIDRLYEGREHVQLTVGTLKNGRIECVHYDEKQNVSDEKLIYPVGSICKTFTASLLAKHIKNGSVDLKASLSEYIKGLPSGYYPTVERLLTHHSGYGIAPFNLLQMLEKLMHMNRENGLLHVNPFRGYPVESDMMKTLSNERLKDRDYKFEYSNFAFGVLGYIAGLVEGTDFFTAMENYVAELGLEDTSLKNSDMTGYDKKGNACKPWQWENVDIIAPAGALLSSMEDLLKFAKLNLDGLHPYLDICHKKYADGDKNFDQGLAWRVKKDSQISYHVGNAGAFTCVLAIDRAVGNAVAIGLNYALVDVEELAFSMLA